MQPEFASAGHGQAPIFPNTRALALSHLPPMPWDDPPPGLATASTSMAAWNWLRSPSPGPAGPAAPATPPTLPKPAPSYRLDYSPSWLPAPPPAPAAAAAASLDAQTALSLSSGMTFQLPPCPTASYNPPRPPPRRRSPRLGLGVPAPAPAAAALALAGHGHARARLKSVKPRGRHARRSPLSSSPSPGPDPPTPACHMDGSYDSQSHSRGPRLPPPSPIAVLALPAPDMSRVPKSGRIRHQVPPSLIAGYGGPPRAPSRGPFHHGHSQELAMEEERPRQRQQQQQQQLMMSSASDGTGAGAGAGQRLLQFVCFTQESLQEERQAGEVRSTVPIPLPGDGVDAVAVWLPPPSWIYPGLHDGPTWNLCLCHHTVAKEMVKELAFMASAGHAYDDDRYQGPEPHLWTDSDSAMDDQLTHGYTKLKVQVEGEYWEDTDFGLLWPKHMPADLLPQLLRRGAELLRIWHRFAPPSATCSTAYLRTRALVIEFPIPSDHMDSPDTFVSFTVARLTPQLANVYF